jgi:hypothetical protein
LASSFVSSARHGEPGAFNIADPNDEVSTDKATAALGWRADFGWI